MQVRKIILPTPISGYHVNPYKMNGLSLRISSGSKNPKNTMSFPPVVLTDYKGARNESIDAFLIKATGEEQLAILKQLLDKPQDDLDPTTISFLVSVFFHSEAKHPIKGFLTRYITKNKHLHQPFIELLTTELDKQMKSVNLHLEDYKHFKEIIHKVSMCIENFNPGVQAVRNVDVQLAVFLTHCLHICLQTIQNGRDILSPTEKNDIYSLVHLTLRLLLHIITKQKSVGDQAKIKMHLAQVAVYPTLHQLLEDKEVPMDAKSVCGIVILSGCNIVWKDVLCDKYKIMPDDHVQLAMFSAILTTVPMQELQEEEIDSKPAIEILIQNFMDIIERGSGDGILILGVSRALHQISKGLHALGASAGRPAARRLLAFVWPHLDHYLDSVRHLANQSLTLLVQYCAALDATDEGEELERVLDGLGALGVARGAFAALAGAARCAGSARLLRRRPLAALLPALACTHVANTAAATLSSMLEIHSRETDAAAIHTQWVLPILQFIHSNELDSDVLTILENLLAKAVKLDENLLAYVLPHITEACASPTSDLRHILTLASAVRASRGDSGGQDSDDHWRGIIPYSILEEAIVDANDEVRIQCLSLLSSGGRATAREAALVLRYLRHCASAQAPHTRQRAQALMKKFLKRVLEGHRTATRSGDVALVKMYEDFVQQLTDICVAGLAQYANYSRRCTALQLLHATVHSALHSPWQPHYVDKLLQRLDDSYETNKALALEILLLVPVQMLQDAKKSNSLQLADVIEQANALAPTECVSAAYKLELIWRRMPDACHALQGQASPTSVEPALYMILKELCDKLSIAPTSWRNSYQGYNVLLAPRDRPTYGLLYCIAHLIDRMDVQAIVGDRDWSQLFKCILIVCNDCVNETQSVVNNVSPEGIMPADCRYTDYGNNAGVILEDGRQVTAQMVLLCAWRTVKEATAVLGAMGSRLPVTEQYGSPLGADDLLAIAECLGEVVSEARHRGAFEQAYVAYERVLYRMWREPNCRVRNWMKSRLQQTLEWLESGASWKHGASRRSAGLPFHIQALVSSEVDCGGPGSALGPVMRALLAAADTGARAHVCNVLRALYRDSSLHAAVQSYVGEGLQVAIKGFEGASWEERNSSTLLLSALIQRVFGVSRARASLTARDKMTGRVFFLRYPMLYDVMLDKLKEVSANDNKKLFCPSLYPVLLLLARLYPSSLEGTESNIKLVSFVPYVVACARSPVLKTRRLAAAAAVSLIPPDRYVSHLCYLLGLISEATVERNFCHGILLQICALLDSKGSDVDCRALAPSLRPTAWILAQAPGAICYPLLQQYVRLLSTLLDRFPETLPAELLIDTELKLDAILFAPAAGVAPGRQLCLSDCLSLALALHERKASSHVVDLIIRGLEHDVQEVCGAALDYVLRLSGRGDSAVAADAREGSSRKVPGAEAVLANLRSRPRLLGAVRRRARDPTIWFCDPQFATKLLEVLVLEDCIDELISSAPAMTVREMFDGVPEVSTTRHMQMRNLAYLLSREDRRSHLYVEALTRCLSKQCDEYKSMPSESNEFASYGGEQRLDLQNFIVGLQHVVLLGCNPGLSLATRAVSARFLSSLLQQVQELADNLPYITYRDLSSRGLEENLFMLEVYPLVGISWLLRDEEASIRTLAADALRPQGGRSVVPALAESALLARCGRGASGVRRLSALALTYPGFRRYSDAWRYVDENRVFDESEKFNVYSEDELWTIRCADKVIELCAEEGVDPVARFNNLLQNDKTIMLNRRCLYTEVAKELFLKTLSGEAA